jgi:hypothetical protein
MIMAESTETVGLCSTCNNSPTCFHRARRGPALFCEMFDDYVASVLCTEGRRPASSAGPPTGLSAAAEEVSRYAGLCMNCEHRRSCRHPRPEGGVWHCEDYE